MIREESQGRLHYAYEAVFRDLPAHNGDQPLRIETRFFINGWRVPQKVWEWVGRWIG